MADGSVAATAVVVDGREGESGLMEDGEDELSEGDESDVSRGSVLIML